MRKKTVFGLMLVVIFVFNSSVYALDPINDWFSEDKRVDTDLPGADSSNYCQISSSGNNVYVVWRDSREGGVYFNYSPDGGQTWLGTDKRLNTDTAGIDPPQISSSGNNVYVAWTDNRNGEVGVYFNYSADGGNVWLNTDKKLNTGGVGASYFLQISSSGNNVYVVWVDNRNGALSEKTYLRVNK